MDKLNILEQREIMGKTFTIYGTAENPLFLAKEVASLIEYDVSSIHKMINSIEANEKVRKNVPTPGGQQECWFLTEDGLYEVLMQSRKPIAKQFKTKVKEILRTIRKTGTYSAEQTLPEPVFTPAVRTYRDRRVLTIKDIAQLIGKDEHALVYYLRNKKSKCKEGTDYHLLKGDELRQFKKDNNLSTYPSSLFVVLESGFRKLCKFFGLLPSAYLPATTSKMVPSVTSSPNEEKVTEKPDIVSRMQEEIKRAKRAIIALDVTLDVYKFPHRAQKDMGDCLSQLATNVHKHIGRLLSLSDLQTQ